LTELLSDQIYENIINGIITGNISQATILTQSQLSEDYDVSISPVREALTRLCCEGILYSIPRYGYKIKLVDSKYYSEISNLRLILEPEYLNKYFDSITDVDIQTIRKTTLVFSQDIAKNPVIYWKKTSGFHLALAYAYRDEFFYDELSSILNKQLITFSQLYWNKWTASLPYRLIDNHSDVINSIEEKDKERAIFLLRQDIKSF